MKFALFALAALSLPLAAQAADANLELAQKKNCMACHAIDHKIVGPAYKDVAAKYAKDKDAAARLSAKIISGGTGVWGTMVMPPNAVTPEEATQLAKWVLSQK